MAELYAPPPFVAIYAKCINDALPNFEPDEWIEKGRCYKVKHFTEPLNITEGTAITILDAAGEEIHPSPSHWSFASSRFVLYSVYLN